MANVVLAADISHFQGNNLDFGQIAAAGIDLVIAKAVHGTGLDGTFQRNWKEMNGKVIRGRYGWYIPGHDPIAQADALVSAGEDVPGDFPVSVDFEQPSPFKGAPLIEGITACIRRVRELTGRKPLLYTGKWYWDQYCLGLDAPELVELCDLWHAEYPSSKRTGVEYTAALSELNSPHPAFPWQSRNIAPKLWQFNGDGGLRLPNGVDADFNRFEGSPGDLVQYIASSFLGTQSFVGESVSCIDPPPDTLRPG